MADEFMGPSQVMGQQLQGVLQMASETAANKRAAIANMQFQQAKMAKDMEVNFALAEKMYATDKVEALKYFNAGLQYLGRSATMEQFDPAFKLFQAAAEAKQQNDPIAMGLILKQAAGKLTNVSDMQRAASMESWSQQEMAKRQAQAVTDLQPEPAGLARARELTQMGDALQQGALSPGLQEKMMALTGTDNQEEWRNQYIQAEAIVQGQEKKREAYQRLFSLNPQAFGVASQQLAHGFSNVQDAALARVSDLAMQETRTPEEEREYQAKLLMFPHLATAAGIKTAQSELERRQAALAETQQRLGALDANLGVLKNATSGAASVDAATAGLPSAGEPLPDAAARDHAMAQGVRDTEGQLFLKQHEGTIASLEQTAIDAEQQMRTLHIMAMARPGQRETIDDRIRELGHTAKAARAQARLFRDENAYILSQRQADVAMEPDVNARQDKQEALNQLESAKKADLAIVEQERKRLAQRETMLQSRMTEAERKALEQQKMNTGVTAVLEAMRGGMSQPKAVAMVADRMHLQYKDLSGEVTAWRGTGVSEAQSEYAFKLAAYGAKHKGEMPPQYQLKQMRGDIAKKYGIDMDKLETVEREPVGRTGGGLDSKDLQQMYTNVLNAAAKLSGETGMRFSTDSSGMAQFEMGTIKDVKALAEKMVLLAEEQTFLPPQVRDALLKTAQRLGGTPTATAPTATSPTELSPDARERALREKLKLP